MPIESSPQVLTDVSVDPFVRGLLHRPATPNGDGLVLTHGAGSNCQAPLLIALAETFADAGFIVLRCDLPYRQDRPYGPPGPGDAQTRSRRTEECSHCGQESRDRPRLSRRPFLRRTPGQHALRRTAEKSTEEAPELAAGLLLLSYPLHPPRKARPAPHPAFFSPAHARPLCCKARAIPSARSQKSSKP